MRSLLADIRYALRLLAKNPGFTFICIFTLALGIGANTAIFSVVNAVLLKPLSYPAPDRLFSLKGSHSLPDVLDVAREAKSVQALGTFADWNLDLVQGAEPERVDAAIVGGDLFPALGVTPIMGRYFTAEDDTARKPVVLVSNGFWQRHLGARSDVIGSSLHLSGTSYTVIGVMPPAFKLPAGKSEVGFPSEPDTRKPLTHEVLTSPIPSADCAMDSRRSRRAPKSPPSPGNSASFIPKRHERSTL